MSKKMHLTLCTAVYTALACVANPLLAELPELPDSKLNLHETPIAVSDTGFEAPDGETVTLEDFEGDLVVMNFWATWCAPCRKEMPSLATLREQTEDENITVIALATGPNPPAAVARFLAEIGEEDLPIYRDPRQLFARDMGVLGLPATVIISPEGEEIARLVGEADWGSDEMIAYLRALRDLDI